MILTKKFIFLSAYLFFSLCLSAQDSKILYSGIEDRIYKQYDILVSGGDPDSLLHNFRTLRKQSEKVGYSEGALTCTIQIIDILSDNKRDLTQLIEESKIGERLAVKLKRYAALIQIYQLQSNAYNDLGLIDLSFKQLEKATTSAENISDINEKNITLANTYINIANYYGIKKDNKNRFISLHKSQQAVKNVADTSEYLRLAKNNLLASQLEALACAHEDSRQLDSAETYYLAAYKLRNEKDILYLLFQKTQLLFNISDFYFRQKNYRTAINFAQLGLDTNKEYILPKLRKEFYQVLYKSYLEINKIDSSKFYSRLFSDIDDSITEQRKLNLNSFFQKKVAQQKSDYNEHLKTILLVVAIVLIVLILFIWYWIRISKSRIHQKYQALITKLSQKETMEEKPNIVDKEYVASKRSTYIPDETVALLLKKLQKFEISNRYTRKDLTLSSLAHHLGTNTRYISEIIKAHRGQNFNGYINTLRIQFITQKLYEEPQFRKYKIAYLAETAGFSSAIVFTTIFKNKTGMTPYYFINQLVKNDESKVS
ncbi:helix-turn-helix domain-containing protein [Sphingobacterium sp. BIGb0165]|uniref:helix-turn-helix domain-containing protein n=1 Tax=Sphingobacterium sp. BIGb0165 TaxID=2940615 RepID=UPI00216A237F|nr:helix-turn-helix domain-containing protein [Sphingobacterium sp. BIGb0165]MCS4224622.1 YesN/AraC family two-component response regulator [Sphingobacterium sp. BIGb0165]